MENNNDQQGAPLHESKDRKLTVLEFKSCPGCEHYSDEEAEEITDTIYRLAIFLIDRATIDIADNNFNNIKQAA